MILSKKQVVIITDCVDIAFNEMYQTLLNETKALNYEDFHIAPLVSVKNFSVVNASFVIRLLGDLYPAGTIFAIIVSGTDLHPARIFGETKNGIIFIGNNSGYLGWFLEDFGLAKLYENNLNRQIESKSFGGKYVQIPTAARLLAGEDFNTLGIERDEAFLHKLSLTPGTIVHCDNFGLMKIKSPKFSEFKEGEALEVFLNGKFAVKAHYTEKMKLQKDGNWVLFTGSSLYGLPELGRVRSQNSAAELGAQEGDVITWRKVKNIVGFIK